MTDKVLPYIIYGTVMYVSYLENGIILQYQIIVKGRLVQIHF